MAFPEPSEWTRDAADLRRDEVKREWSPCSSFFAQAQALNLAAAYFEDTRLSAAALAGVAKKHRHRMQLALFGQLMASFEFLLKDFVARVIDVAPGLDDRIAKAAWINLEVGKLLSHRETTPTIGALLVHPTMGWHNVPVVNARYQELFDRQAISNAERGTLERLWILRHTVAHNAGWLTVDDSVRMGAQALGGKVVNTDDAFILETFEFLKPIARRLREIAEKKVLDPWLEKMRDSGADFARDEVVYKKLKLIAYCEESRAQDLPAITQALYDADFARVNP